MSSDDRADRESPFNILSEYRGAAHAPDLAVVAKVNETFGFGAPAKPPAKLLRRRRTGRTAQFSIKAKAETIARFVQIADEHGWVFGETLEHLVETFDKAKAALQRQGA
jgi:hypothetical protein